METWFFSVIYKNTPLLIIISFVNKKQFEVAFQYVNILSVLYFYLIINTI
jgi:hypothetical protein